MKKIFLAFFVAWAFLCLHETSVAKDRDINLWPLLTLDKDDLSSDLHYLIPLGRIAENETEKVNRLFPFHLYKRDLSTVSLDLVWPLFNTTNQPGEFRSLRLLPFNGFWGVNGEYLAMVFPMYWQFKNDESQGVIVPPVWYVKGVRNPDSYRIGLAPLYCSWNADSKGFWFAPVLNFRNSEGDFLGILPLWAKWNRNNTQDGGFWLMPALWDKSANGDYLFSVVPFYWHWNHGTVIFPVYWQSDERLVLFPFYWQTDDYQVLFPFYWSLDYGKLFMIFPIYGRFRGNNETWTAIMLPAYLESTKGDYNQKNILWPLLRWGSDGKTRKEFSLFPFYTRTWKDGYREPHGEIFHDADETGVLALLNWGQRSTYYETNKGGQFRRSLEGYSLIPFLFVDTTQRRETAADGSEQYLRNGQSTTVFPFFWKSQSDRWHCATDKRSEEISEGQSLNLFPVFWSGTENRWEAKEKTKQKQTHHSRHHWVLPLYTFNEYTDMKIFTALWPLWSQTEKEDEDSYSVLLKIAEARFHDNGDRRVSVLWRGYRDEIQGEQRKVSVFPFISHKRTSPGNWRTKFLEGFWEIGEESGDNYFRVLYSPKIGLK